MYGYYIFVVKHLLCPIIEVRQYKYMNKEDNNEIKYGAFFYFIFFKTSQHLGHNLQPHIAQCAIQLKVLYLMVCTIPTRQIFCSKYSFAETFKTTG
eukprot:UN00661